MIRSSHKPSHHITFCPGGPQGQPDAFHLAANGRIGSPGIPSDARHGHTRFCPGGPQGQPEAFHLAANGTYTW